MCASLCLVIRTVNDRDAWGDREIAGGECGLVVRVGVEWVSRRFEPYQGFTAGHNSMCGDCVEGLASRAPSLPPWPVVCGGRGFRFQSFFFSSFLWLVRCLCSQGEGQFGKK